MTTTSQKGFKIGPPMPDIEGGSKIPQALNNPVALFCMTSNFYTYSYGL